MPLCQIYTFEGTVSEGTVSEGTVWVHQGGIHIYTGVCVLKFSEHLFK